MSNTWHSENLPPAPKLGVVGAAVGIIRAFLTTFLVFGGLLVLLCLRLIERPFFGARRPVTPLVTQFVCRNCLRILGIGYKVTGTPMKSGGAMVANHSSWLDIFVLNAASRLYFVSKSEVASWPGIGWLARATGTVFLRRERREAAVQVNLFRERLANGHRLVFFPEGTSTDGLQVLPFKPTLFAAFFDPALKQTMQIQAVTICYSAPQGKDSRYYGWWGNMDFGPHLWSVLATLRQGTVHVTYHPPVSLSQFSDRKELAKVLEDQVRSAMPVRT